MPRQPSNSLKPPFNSVKTRLIEGALLSPKKAYKKFLTQKAEVVISLKPITTPRCECGFIL